MSTVLTLLFIIPGATIARGNTLPRTNRATAIQFLPCGNIELTDLFWNKRLKAIREQSYPQMTQHISLRHAKSQQKKLLADNLITTARNLRMLYPFDSLFCHSIDSLLTANDVPTSTVPTENIITPILYSALELTGAIRASDGRCRTTDALNAARYNLRQFQQTGDGRYIDLFEQTLFNALTCAFNLSGDSCYTYLPAEHTALPVRLPWHRDKATFSSLVAFLSGVPQYFCATRGKEVFLNIYTRGNITVHTDSLDFQLMSKASYPWAGDVVYAFMTKAPQRCTLKLRVPAWLTDSIPSTDNRLKYVSGTGRIELYINNDKVSLPVVNGYVSIDREWHDGDFIGMRFPMNIRRVVNTGATAVALQRGPLVYVWEDKDQTEAVNHAPSNYGLNLPLPLHTEFNKTLLDKIQIITGTLTPAAQGEPQPFTAIPFYDIGQRGAKGNYTLWVNIK